MNENETFASLGISSELEIRLNEKGIEKPTNVQKNTIPLLLEEKNVVFQSETGTGKTLAFLLPLLERLENKDNPKKAVKILIISPTFELSSQLKEACHTFSKLKSTLLIGGAPLKRQIEILKEKPSIVIGNPARLLELARLKKLKLSDCEAVVLDEADRLFTKEIRDETNALLSLLPRDIQCAACSATISKDVKNSVEDHFGKSEEVLLAPEDVLKHRITHWALYAERREKIDLLRSFLNAEKPLRTLIFTTKPDQVEIIRSKLAYKKINCAALNSKTKNQDRKTTLDRFKSGKCSVLITSDLASRGLDIQDITHVIQMDVPSDDDFFVHRAGRTARAGKKGINVVIGDEYELRKLSALEKKLGFIVYPKMLYKGKVVAPPADNGQDDSHDNN